MWDNLIVLGGFNSNTDRYDYESCVGSYGSESSDKCSSIDSPRRHENSELVDCWTLVQAGYSPLDAILQQQCCKEED